MNYFALSLLCSALALLVAGHREAAIARVTPRKTTKTPRDGPADKPAEGLVMAADIDLFAACVRAGLSAQQAAAALAQASHPQTRAQWERVASLLRIGAEPQRAWATVADLPGLGELGRTVVAAEASGAAIAGACQRLAKKLRDDASAQAIAKAERAGVFIALPLAACFLPAFILLGLVPVVIGLGTQLL